MKAMEEICVLVIDDDATVHSRVTEALAPQIAARVLAARAPGDGIRLALEERPAVILLDVNMPGRPGFYALRDLKSDPATRDIPVIMLTGVSEQIGVDFTSTDLYDFLGYEPDLFLEKPVDPKYLSEVAGNLLGRGKSA